MSFLSRKHPLALAVSSLLSVLSVQAVAQQAPAADKDPIETISVLGSYTVAEKIDTATGLGLTLLETPQSVSVMTSQRILDQALNTVVDTVLNAPGVSAKEIDNVRNTLRARGFDINNYQIDGVPLSWSLAGDSGETIADVAIFERVEFVRGATGLLTGAGDPSASINLVRKHATSTELTGYVNATVGSWAHKELTADVASGLNQSGSLRGRMVAKYAAGDSYTDLFATDTRVLYGVLEADLGSSALLRMGASVQKNQPTAPTWGSLPSFFDDGSVIEWDVSKTTAADWTQWDTEGRNFFANLNYDFSNGWHLAVNYNRLEYSQSTRLLYLYGIVEKDTGDGLASWPYKSHGDSIQDSIDIQLSGDFNAIGQNHEFVVGYLYGDHSADTNSYAPLTNAFLPVEDFFNWDGNFPQPDWSDEANVEQALDTVQKGVYAATRLHLGEMFKLIAGGRVSSFERKGVSYGVEQNYGNSGEFVPYLGALLDLGEQHRLYASYTEIFKPQNAYDASGDILDPVSGKNLELGLKSRFLDDMLHTSIAIFSIDQDNVAQADEANARPGDNFFPSFGAQGTTSKGFEVELVGRPTDAWNLSIGYSQFKAEDVNDVEVNTDHPRKQFKLFSTYEFSGDLAGLMVGGGINWQDDSYSISPNPVTGDNQRLSQGSYSLVSLMARYDLSEALQVQLNLDNLLDETYYSQIGFFSQYRYGAPRNVKLGLTYRF